MKIETMLTVFTAIAIIAIVLNVISLIMMLVGDSEESELPDHYDSYLEKEGDWFRVTFFDENYNITLTKEIKHQGRNHK